ncbi:MAG: chromosomal replication initiator protein DnaA [Clostridia bacterium]|nr:chromosomal replication initiator protein DnaA [Clostridia bacterium]
MQSAEIIWNKAKSALKEKITQISYNMWIADIEPISLKDNVLTLYVQSEIKKNTLNTLYKQIVEEEVSNAASCLMTVVFTIKMKSDEEEIKDTTKEAPISQSLNPNYTFDKFVIGNSNSLAYAAAKAVAENPASSYNPLFIYGGVGLGKTHLMQAIGNHRLKMDKNANVIYITSETFTNEIIDAIRIDKRNPFRNKYRTADLLLVDDVQFIAGKTGTQEEFFNTFNALHSSGKQIILTSDRPPKELNTLEERLRSRFEWGLITDIQQPDVETRIAILKEKAIIEGIDIKDDVLTFIAERVDSNIRQLEGALNNVIAYAQLTKRSIDIRLADTALKNIISNYQHTAITMDLIKQVVADYYSIDVQSLSSQKRTMDITFPRQVAMYLCKKLTENSYKAIGKDFGNRDHSTVISACNKIEEELKKNTQFSVTIEDIEKRLKK